MKSYSANIIDREEFDNFKKVNKRQDLMLKIIGAITLVNTGLIGFLLYRLF